MSIIIKGHSVKTRKEKFDFKARRLGVDEVLSDDEAMEAELGRDFARVEVVGGGVDEEEEAFSSALGGDSAVWVVVAGVDAVSDFSLSSSFASVFSVFAGLFVFGVVADELFGMVDVNVE